MVQIAKAWAVNRMTGDEKEIAASDVDKKRDADFDFLCPDKCCRVPLTHYNAHNQTFIDNITDPKNPTARNLTVAAHFQRKGGGPRHDDACDAVDDYTKYQIFARSLGGVSHQHGVFVFNLNIPTSDETAPLRQRVSPLTEKFRQRALDKLTKPEEDIPSEGRPAPKSIGLKDVEKLAGLLDVSAFDPKYRESILLRDGPRIISLSEIYKDNSIALYREEFKRSQRSTPANPVLIHFKPIAIGKYHSKHERTIQGIATPIAASDGKAKYSVSVMLHCETDELYKNMKDDIKVGGRSFLLYASRAYVDLIEFAHKKRDMEIGAQRDNAVFVHVHIARPEQIVQWTPPAAQMELNLTVSQSAAPREPEPVKP